MAVLSTLLILTALAVPTSDTRHPDAAAVFDRCCFDALENDGTLVIERPMLNNEPHLVDFKDRRFIVEQ